MAPPKIDLEPYKEKIEQWYIVENATAELVITLLYQRHDIKIGYIINLPIEFN